MKRAHLLVAATSLACVAALTGCAPKALGASTAEEPAAQASGALAQGMVVVEGDAKAKYVGALSQALTRAGVHVSDKTGVAGMHVVLHVKGPTFEEAADDDDAQVSFNVANYDVEVLVMQRGGPVDRFTDAPQFNLEELAGTTVIKSIQTKDEADGMFCSRVMTHFANQIVGSPQVAAAAARATATQ
jgi:hypothetical protein